MPLQHPPHSPSPPLHYPSNCPHNPPFPPSPQSEIDELGARLEGEIQRRKEIEEELQSREAQLENLREHLREVEGERANLTVELRDSLAAYKELSDR